MQHSTGVWPRFLRYGLLAVIALMPFQTFVTVWLAQEVGHLYAISAWKELLTIVLSAGALYLLITNKALLAALVARKYNLLFIVYGLLFFLYLPFASDLSGFFVGLAINVRFVLLFLVAQIAGFYYPDLLTRCLKFVAVVGAVVAALALLQVVLLPVDFLAGYGYDLPGQNTAGIPPAYHLVADSGLSRAQATLRGPNALGAYLILPLAIWFYTFLKRRHMALSAAACGVIGLAILCSHSRSAWLGAAAAMLLVVVWAFAPTRRQVGTAAACLVVAAGLGFAVLSNNTWFRQVVLHDVVSNTTVQDSNDGHLQATLRGIRDVIRQPLGSGPGSAGPASALGGADAEISENYYVQVAQEAGLVGGLLFLAAQIWVMWGLWQRRTGPWEYLVFAAGIGLIVTNVLLHTWADEAVAMTWWLVAGAALPLALPKNAILSSKRKHYGKTKNAQGKTA